jgi:MFS family permease
LRSTKPGQVKSAKGEMLVSVQMTGQEHTEATEGGTVTRDSSGAKLRNVILLMVLATTSIAYIRMLDPGTFGIYGDDGVYVTTAKALETGQGYRIVSLPYEPSQILYPPLHPFLLSLIWKAYPQFPENVLVMVLLSIAAALSFLALSYRYLVRQGYATAWQALIVVAVAAINWRTMYWATLVLSDMLCASISVAGLCVAENYEKEERSGWRRGVVLGVIMGLAFLTRTAAITLILAVAVYFVMRRKWRRVLVPVAIAGLVVVGWAGWCYLNRTSFSGSNSEYYSGYARCFSEAYKYLHTLNGTSMLATFAGVMGTNFALLVIASVPVACLGLGYGLPLTVFFMLIFLTLALIAGGFLRQARKGLRLLHVYLVLHVGLHLILPGIAYDRYVAPVVPFLLVLLVTELHVAISTVVHKLKSSGVGKTVAACVGGTLLLAISLALYSNFSAMYKLLAAASFKKTAKPGAEYAQAIEWINTHTEPSDVLVTNCDPMYYLYTGRKATASYSLIMLTTVPYQARRPTFDEQARVFLDIASENKGAYVVFNDNDFKYESEVPGESILELVERSPQNFTPVFQAPDGRSRIYRIIGNLD